ncbi:MAG TPA: hypothetical protein VNK92_05645 [Vicinamibacterales bacterium]|nr:hypothetical protein [Vicinamibacterales bacterium]
MPPPEEIARIAADTRASASALLPRVLPLLQEARTQGRALLEETARALCRAQPAMANLWNAAAAALDPDPRVLETFAERARRAPRAIARHVAGLLGDERPESPGAPSPADRPGSRRDASPLRIVTLSSSGVVRAALLALAARVPVRVSCAESRPGGEGREEAAALAAAGLEVEFLPDAALGLALAEAQAALLGADAVAPDWFTNKVGSGLLAAAATVGGTPVYVLAGSEKLVARELAALMSLPEAADSVWPEAPPQVRVRAPLFERVPWDRVAALVTEAGVLSGRMVGEACEGAARRVRAGRLVALLRTKG